MTDTHQEPIALNHPHTYLPMRTKFQKTYWAIFQVNFYCDCFQTYYTSNNLKKMTEIIALTIIGFHIYVLNIRS